MLVKTIFWISVIFNVIDALATWFSVCHLKIAVELNPLMAAMIKIDPLFFVLFKIVLGTAAITFLYKHHNRHWAALYGLYLAFGVYTLIVLVHAVNFGFYLTN